MPYLLRGTRITHRNQAWSTDISYIPMENNGIRISMDGRARCLDNVWIECFWRTIKREYIYLNPESSVYALRNGIRKYIDYYNHRRCHQGLGHQVPCMVYAAA